MQDKSGVNDNALRERSVWRKENATVTFDRINLFRGQWKKEKSTMNVYQESDTGCEGGGRGKEGGRWLNPPHAHSRKREE